MVSISPLPVFPSRASGVRHGCEAHPNWDCQRPFERSIHGSAGRSCGHRPLVFALCRAWPSTQFEPESMPARNGVRWDDKECLFPVSPEPASYDPEEFVDGSQPWPRLLALKDGELLTKGEVFEHQTAVRPKPAKHGSEPEPKQVKNGHQVIADRLCRLPCEVVALTAGQDCDEGTTPKLPALIY